MRTVHISLIAIFLLFSCSYEPTGVHDVAVNSLAEMPIMTIDYTNDGDTILIDRSTTLRFHYSTGDKGLNYAYAFINSAEIGTEVKTGQYIDCNIDPSLVGSGSYEFTVMLFSNSQTGSLADLMKLEGFFYTRTWTLIVIDKSEMTPDIYGYTIENGLLKLLFNQNHPELITEYSLEKRLRNEDNKIIATSTDTENKFLFDDSYVGEYACYTLTSKTVFGYELTSHYFTMNDSISTVMSQNVSSFDEIHYYWKKCPYYNAYESYKLRLPDGEEIIIDDINRTEGVINSLFGDVLRFRISIIPKNKPDNFDEIIDNFTKESYLISGEGIPGPVKPMKLGGRLFILYNNRLMEYDPEMNILLDTLDIPSGQSRTSYTQNGKYALFAFSYEKQFIFFEPGVTQDLVPVTTEGLIGEEVYIGEIVLSDNGIAAFYGSPGGLFHIYDFPNNKYIGSFDIQTDIRGLAISSGGKYLIYDDVAIPRFFEIGDSIIESDRLKEIKNGTFDEMQFLVNDPDLLIYKDYGMFSIINVKTAEIVSSFAISTSENLVYYDLIDNRLVTNDNDYLRIYNFITGEQIYPDIPHDFGYSDNCCALIGDYLYTNKIRVKVF